MEQRQPSSRQQALELAFRYIAHKPRTVAEVRGRLADREVEPELIDEVVAQLEQDGYLDDAEYALNLAAEKRDLHHWGNERIERRLLSVGVAPEAIERALGTRDNADEFESALILLRRRFPEPPADDTERQRALGLLARKGYELELCYEAIRRYSHAE